MNHVKEMTDASCYTYKAEQPIKPLCKPRELFSSSFINLMMVFSPLLAHNMRQVREIETA